MLARRHVLLSAAGCAAAGALSACGAGRGAPSSSPTGQTASVVAVRLETAIGAVSVRSSGAESLAWRRRIEQAARRVAPLWGRAPAEVHVDIVEDPEQFARRGGSGVDTAAVTTPSGIVVGPDVQRSLTEAGRIVVLAHELTHAVLRQYGDDPTASWLKEGAAEWTAHQGLTLGPRRLWPELAATHDRAASAITAPPDDAVMASDPRLGYEEAEAFVTYLAAISSRAHLVEFVRARPSDGEARREAERLSAGKQSFTSWLSLTLK